MNEEASLNHMSINSHPRSEDNDDDDNSRVRLRDHNNDYLEQNRENQRPRRIDGYSIPGPFNDNIASRAAIRHTTISRLSSLTEKGAEPSMFSAINVQILRIIVHNPHVQNGSNIQAYSRSRFGSVRPSSMPYTRLLLCRVFSEEDGNLLVYLMESPSLNKNCNLWLNNVELRDNGVITVGAVFRIISPLPITNYLRGDIPLIETHHPVIVLKQPKSYNSIIPLDNLQGESSRAFILNGTLLSCTTYSCEKTKCGGSFCDRQRLNEWNTPIGSCGCYAQRSRGTNNLTFMYPLVKATYNGKTFVHKDFSSHLFTQIFINHDFPIGIQANDLQLSEAYWLLGNSLQSMIRFVNSNGGWTIIGWYSRGVINDKTLTGMISSTNNQNNAEVQVDGGDLNYHFCKIVPTDTSLLDTDSVNGRLLNEMKFDVNGISAS